MTESGLWTALRGRPFGRVADPRAKPHSIFVTAIDTSPYAPSVTTVLAGAGPAFERGLFAVAKLTDGPVFVCTSPASSLPLPQLDQIRHEEFAGPHPAGTVGVHIHTLDPVDRNKMVWHLGYQDLVTIGKLFETGTLHVERVIALAGPAVKRPRLIRTRVGASTDELVKDELHDPQGLPGLQGLHEGEHRVISGSVLSGRTATGEVFGYLGRYHQQISVLREGREREFLGWLAPGFNKFSTVNYLRVEAHPWQEVRLHDVDSRLGACDRSDRHVRTGYADGHHADVSDKGAGGGRRRACRRARMPSSSTKRIWLCAPSSARARPSTDLTCVKR